MSTIPLPQDKTAWLIIFAFAAGYLCSRSVSRHISSHRPNSAAKRQARDTSRPRFINPSTSSSQPARINNSGLVYKNTKQARPCPSPGYQNARRDTPILRATIPPAEAHQTISPWPKNSSILEASTSSFEGGAHASHIDNPSSELDPAMHESVAFTRADEIIDFASARHLIEPHHDTTPQESFSTIPDEVPITISVPTRLNATGENRLATILGHAQDTSPHIPMSNHPLGPLVPAHVAGPRRPISSGNSNAYHPTRHGPHQPLLPHPDIPGATSFWGTHTTGPSNPVSSSYTDAPIYPPTFGPIVPLHGSHTHGAGLNYPPTPIHTSVNLPVIADMYSTHSPSRNDITGSGDSLPNINPYEVYPPSVIRRPPPDPYPRTHRELGIVIVEKSALVVDIGIKGSGFNIFYLEKEVERWVRDSKCQGQPLELRLELNLMATVDEMRVGLKTMKNIFTKAHSRIGTLHIVVPDMRAHFPGFTHDAAESFPPGVFPMLTSFTWHGNVKYDLPEPIIALSRLPLSQLTTLQLHASLGVKDCIEILYRCPNLTNFMANPLGSVRYQTLHHSFYRGPCPFAMTKLKSLELVSQRISSADAGLLRTWVEFPMVKDLVLRMPCSQSLLATIQTIAWASVQHGTLIGPLHDRMKEHINRNSANKWDRLEKWNPFEE